MYHLSTGKVSLTKGVRYDKYIFVVLIVSRLFDIFVPGPD